MNWRFSRCALLAMTLSAFTSGCASDGSVSEAKSNSTDPGKGRWVTLDPPIGSHIPRRVWVDASGIVSNANPGVETVSPEAFRRMQDIRNQTSGISGGGGQ